MMTSLFSLMCDEQLRCFTSEKVVLLEIPLITSAAVSVPASHVGLLMETVILFELALRR